MDLCSSLPLHLGLAEPGNVCKMLYFTTRARLFMVFFNNLTEDPGGGAPVPFQVDVSVLDGSVTNSDA